MLETRFEVEVRACRNGEGIHGDVPRACLHLRRAGSLQAGDIRALGPGPHGKAGAYIEEPLGFEVRGKHHRGWPLSGMRNRLVHATAPSFLRNRFIRVGAEGCPFQRAPLIHVWTRDLVPS